MRIIISLVLCSVMLLCSCGINVDMDKTTKPTTPSNALIEVNETDIDKYTVDCFGDGFTMGVDTSYTHWLSSMLSYNWKVNNYGARDDTVLGICARQGCVPALLEKITIPNENEYTVCNIYSSHQGKALPKMLVYTTSGFNPVTIKDELFSIKNEAVDDTTSEYSIRPITAVNDNTVIEETTVLKSSYALNNKHESIMIVMMGTDDSYDTIEELVEFNKKMVKGYDRYIVVSEPYKIRGNDRADYDALMLKAFGANYLNAREYIIRNGLKEAQIEATEKDKEQIKNGYTPPSLMTGKYYNEAGNQILAKCIYNKGVELGYWS